MAIQHVREPSKLSNDDYGEFCNVVKTFLADDASQPNRPTHMVPQQATLGNDFNIKLDAYNNARNGQDVATQNVENSIRALREKLRWMQIVLPTLTPGNDEILKGFGFDKPIPSVYAEMKNYADAVQKQWDIVKNEALYAPIKVQADELKSFIGAYELARDTQIALYQEAQQRQNEMDTARAAHHKIERAIFNWYRANYRNPQDEYWEQTPWGKAPGGEEIEQLLPPAGLMFDQFRTQFAWQAVAQATKYQLEVKNKATQQTTTYETDKLTQKAELPQGDYTAKVRAVREASPTEMSDWSAEIAVGIIFAAPQHLKYIPGQHKFTWDAVAGANTYELVQEGVGESVYLGDATECEFEVQSSAKFRVRAGNDESSEWGEWSGWLAVNV